MPVRMNERERLCRALYLKCPQACEQPAQDWQQIVDRYRRRGIHEITASCPSGIDLVIMESKIFREDTLEVVCNRHMRYDPVIVHELRFIKIVYVRKGKITIWLDQARYELCAGNFCIITPGVRHAVFAGHDEDEAMNILMRESSFATAFSGILMEQNILSDFFWKLLYTKHSHRVLLFAVESDPQLDRWVRRMERESLRGTAACNLLMKNYAMVFLGNVMRNHLQHIQLMEELTEEAYTLPVILQYIKKNLKTVTIEELARQFGREEENLKYYIAKEIGYSYRDLLRNLRMHRAAELLQNTSLSVERVMEEVGYNSQSLFYRAFHAYFGKTPMEYRNSTTIIL